ncbi:hypothetical protein ES319_D08G236700v1 [Gossypium barbadense]|uniref:MADS-box domain-containing protein n=1 Tax=Gossypium barbadense TaxID=3634 RepID=A0A5J5QI33_GOSBA|nr:hypothetical protein ES319_D08G236700v1 [Gossypium barbadense]PPD79707.1 hypothetical protein GOBAR_DD23360 [Gossypium barbadense]
MTRKKVKLAYITDDSARKATYKKRTKGLMKKLSELSTLCDIDACSIMYSPYESQLEVWPSPMGVQQVLSKLVAIPEMEKSKNMLNQESFLSQKTTKASEQLKKHCKENWEKEMTQVMFNTICGKGVIHGLNFEALSEINLLLDKKMNDIDKRIDALARTPLNPQWVSSSSSSSLVVVPPMMMVAPKAMPRIGTDNIVQEDVNEMDQIQRQQWIMELMSNNNNLQTHVGGDGMMFQFGDNINSNNGLSSNVVFPLGK